MSSLLAKVLMAFKRLSGKRNEIVLVEGFKLGKTARLAGRL